MVLELEHIIEPAILIILTITGWGVRAMLKRQAETDHKIETLATELRSEMQHYTHKDTCRAHREGIYARVDVIHLDHERTLAAITDNKRADMRSAMEVMRNRQIECNDFETKVKG